MASQTNHQASGKVSHFSYGIRAGGTPSDDPQLPEVALLRVRRDGISVLARRYLAETLPRIGAPDNTGKFISARKNTVPLTGHANLGFSGILGIADAPPMHVQHTSRNYFLSVTKRTT